MALSFLDNQTQAMNLALQWGIDRMRSGAEARAFRAAIDATGIAPRHVCALAGWAGGAVPASELPFFSDGRTSLEDACRTEGFAEIDLVAAIDALNQVAPLLMAVLFVKATRKQEASQASVDANKAQASAKTRAAVAQTLEDASRAVTEAIADPTKLVGAIRSAADVVRGVQLGTVDLLLAAIPGGKWTVAAVGVAALAGGALYLKIMLRV